MDHFSGGRPTAPGGRAGRVGSETLDRIRTSLIGLRMPRALDALDHAVRRIERVTLIPRCRWMASDGAILPAVAARSTAWVAAA